MPSVLGGQMTPLRMSLVHTDMSTGHNHGNRAYTSAWWRVVLRKNVLAECTRLCVCMCGVSVCVRVCSTCSLESSVLPILHHATPISRNCAAGSSSDIRTLMQCRSPFCLTAAYTCCSYAKRNHRKQHHVTYSSILHFKKA